MDDVFYAFDNPAIHLLSITISFMAFQIFIIWSGILLLLADYWDIDWKPIQIKNFIMIISYYINY